jgi:tetratricopeptide (TPR) repeat protein
MQQLQSANNLVESQSNKENPIIWDSFWKNRRNILFLAAIMLLCFLVYIPSLQNGFVDWDDHGYILSNPHINKISTWESFLQNTKEIFSTAVGGAYTPLTVMSFVFENFIYGVEKPKFWHLNNIILHLICVLLVFRISLALGLKIIPASFCALLFGIHPMRVESVAWVTERKDVLYGSFYLLALYYYIKSVKLTFRKRYLLIILTTFILALLSKIQAVVLPLSMLLVDHFFDRKLSLKLFYEKWFYFILSLVTGLVGIYFLNVAGGFEVNHPPPLFKNLLMGSYSYVAYIIKSIVPYKMVPLYPFPKYFDWTFYVSMILSLLILGSTCFFIKKEKKLTFGILFFTFNIIFLLQFKIAGRAYLADRFTYIAYFGLFFLYAYWFQNLLEKYKKFEKLIYITTLIFLSILAILNIEQNKVWKNDETLWSHAIKYYPNEHSIWEMRADYYKKNGQLSKALLDYNQAITLRPENIDIYYKRGKLLYELNDPQSLRLALQDFTNALHFSPEKVKYLIDRGITYINLNMYDNALQDFYAAERLAPEEPLIYYNKSIIYRRLQQHDKVQANLDKYLSFKPDASEIWPDLGTASRLNKQYIKSLNAFNKAIQLDPNNLINYYKRLITYYEMGEIEQARNELIFLKSKGFRGINPKIEKILNESK